HLSGARQQSGHRPVALHRTGHGGLGRMGGGTDGLQLRRCLHGTDGHHQPDRHSAVVRHRGQADERVLRAAASGRGAAIHGQGLSRTAGQDRYRDLEVDPQPQIKRRANGAPFCLRIELTQSFRRQVVTPLLSSSTTPISANWSRMRSDSAQFFSARACRRAWISASISVASTRPAAPDCRYWSASSCSSPVTAASSRRRAPSAAAASKSLSLSLLTSRAMSNSTAQASGVLKSSSMALPKRSTTSSPPLAGTFGNPLIARYKRSSAPLA